MLNSKLDLIQERALQVVCKGSKSEFEKLMKKTLTTHQHNLLLLLIGIYKLSMRNSLSAHMTQAKWNSDRPESQTGFSGRHEIIM